MDSGRSFGTYQADALQNITGTFGSLETTANQSTGALQRNSTTSAFIQGNPAGFQHVLLSFDASRVARTAAETRPRNRAMLFCIKF